MNDEHNQIWEVERKFRKKSELEYKIQKQILEFEVETGLRIDRIIFRRTATLPHRDSRYSQLCIFMDD